MLSKPALLGAAALLALLGEGRARAELVDRIVAIVDREVVTLSEAEQARAIGRARTGEDMPLVDVVERLIESRLVEREVERFTGEPVPLALVDGALEDVRSGFDSDADYRAMLDSTWLSEEALRAELRRQVAITRYLERRFRALAFVSDEEVEAYYRDELPAVAGDEPLPPLSELADSIRRLIEERTFNARVEGWIETLKSRVRIRRYVW